MDALIGGPSTAIRTYWNARASTQECAKLFEKKTNTGGIQKFRTAPRLLAHLGWIRNGTKTLGSKPISQVFELNNNEIFNQKIYRKFLRIPAESKIEKLIDQIIAIFKFEGDEKHGPIQEHDQQIWAEQGASWNCGQRDIGQNEQRGLQKYWRIGDGTHPLPHGTPLLGQTPQRGMHREGPWIGQIDGNL